MIHNLNPRKAGLTLLTLSLLIVVMLAGCDPATPEIGFTDEEMTDVTATLEAAAPEEISQETQTVEPVTEEAPTEPIIESEAAAATVVGTPELDVEAMLEATPLVTVTDSDTMTQTDAVTAAAERDPAQQSMSGSNTVTQTDSMTATVGSDQAQQSGPDIRATNLMESQVFDVNDQEVGEVEDLVVGFDTGRLHYVVVSVEEFLDLVDELVAVPVDQVTIDDEAGTVSLNVEQQMLEDAPRYSAETWPNVADSDWNQSMREYWRDVAAPADAAASTDDQMTEESNQATATVRASNLLETGVINPEGDDLGQIEDMMIDLGANRVEYAVLSFGGFLGLGNDFYAIPLNAFAYGPRGVTLVVNIDEETLENAPGFDLDNWPDTANPNWDVETRAYWYGPATGLTDPNLRFGVLGRTVDEAALRASNVMEYEVQGLDEDVLGQVQDLTIGRDSGQVQYAVITLDQEASSSQSLVAIPFFDMLLDPQNQALVTDLAPEVIEGAISFESDAWPDLSSPEWDTEIRDYWLDAGLTAATAPAGSAVVAGNEPSIRATELFEAEVNLSEMEVTGSLADLVIGRTSRQVNYAVLDLDREVFEGGLIPVPFRLLEVDEAGDIGLQVEPQVLETIPSFNADNWPDLNDPVWDLTYLNYWANRMNTLDLSAVRASTMLGYDAVNRMGDDLGEIDDIVVGTDDGRIFYAVLSYGGFLGLGENYVAVPVGAFEVASNQFGLTLDMDQEILENAPRLDDGDWPGLTTEQWDETVSFWETERPDLAESLTDPDRETELIASVEAMMDYPVQNVQGENLGDIEDLMLDLDEQQVKYAVLSFGGFLDLGEDLFAIPLEQVSFNPVEEVLLFDVTPETLENAPGFERTNWPDTANTQWDADVQNYWNGQQ